jgi:hypothetical protein
MSNPVDTSYAPRLCSKDQKFCVQSCDALGVDSLLLGPEILLGFPLLKDLLVNSAKLVKVPSLAPNG